MTILLEYINEVVSGTLCSPTFMHKYSAPSHGLPNRKTFFVSSQLVYSVYKSSIIFIALFLGFIHSMIYLVFTYTYDIAQIDEFFTCM